MRAAVVEYLMNAARLDKDIWFLTGDLGYSYVKHSKKFILIDLLMLVLRSKISCL